jgi:hypothetical protein
MIHNARQDFERLLQTLHQHAHQASTAYQVERDLFKQLMALGRALLAIFFALAAQRWARPRQAGPPLHSYKRRRYVSLFGEVVLERPYFWQAGAAGAFPMDQALSLPDDAYSDLLREQAELLASQMAYAETARVLEHLLGVRLSPHSLLRLVETDAEPVAAFYEQQAAPAPAEEGQILVIQADGKGVPMRPARAAGPPGRPVRLRRGQSRTRKKEALVTSLYTTAPRVRSPAEVLASFFQGEPAAPEAAPPEARPRGKKLFATLQGKPVALERLATQVRRRDGAHITDRVALSDGCPALQDRLRAQFPAFELVLDFVHVSEYLWKAANALFDEADPAREHWVKARTEELLTGQHAAVVARLRAQSQHARDVLAKVARYFERNTAQMDYRRYLARGWPIASGVIEGACRHLVKDRCEAAGMRWSPGGAEQILALRAVAVNGDWVSYHGYRRRVRHRRLYGRSLEQAEVPEERTLRWAA